MGEVIQFHAPAGGEPRHSESGGPPDLHIKITLDVPERTPAPQEDQDKENRWIAFLAGAFTGWLLG